MTNQTFCWCILFSSRLNALSKEYVVILDCSVLALRPWKYLTSDKSFSCFSNRFSPRVITICHRTSLRCQVCHKENVTKSIELSTMKWLPINWENWYFFSLRLNWKVGSEISIWYFNARVKRCTPPEANGMQMRKTLSSPSLAFDSAHVKYGVWPGPKVKNKRATL